MQLHLQPTFKDLWCLNIYAPQNWDPQKDWEKGIYRTVMLSFIVNSDIMTLPALFLILLLVFL